jgi:hypothetical protein
MPCSLGVRTFRLGVDTALALCNHSLTFRICRCLDAKPSCKKKKESYSLTNNCYRRHNYYDYIGPGGRTRVNSEGRLRYCKVANDAAESEAGCASFAVAIISAPVEENVTRFRLALC